MTRARNVNATVRPEIDRKSTRLNSSHSQISYAVFCLKKKKQSSKRSPALTQNGIRHFTSDTLTRASSLRTTASYNLHYQSTRESVVASALRTHSHMH